MDVIVNGKVETIDREVVKISDLLGLLHIKRVPGMTILVNDKPIRNTLWIKFPILDGDKLDYRKPEEDLENKP